MVCIIPSIMMIIMMVCNGLCNANSTGTGEYRYYGMATNVATSLLPCILCHSLPCMPVPSASSDSDSGKNVYMPVGIRVGIVGMQPESSQHHGSPCGTLYSRVHDVTIECIQHVRHMLMYKLRIYIIGVAILRVQFEWTQNFVVNFIIAPAGVWKTLNFYTDAMCSMQFQHHNM